MTTTFTNYKIVVPDFTPEQIEQIEAAMDKVFQSDMSHKEKLIKALTRTQWKPQVGEVHCWWNEMGKEPFFISYEKRDSKQEPLHKDIKMLPLTAKEVPALAVAIDKMSELRSRVGSTWVQEEIDIVLTEIYQLTGGRN